jgi:hypothetical protein
VLCGTGAGAYFGGGTGAESRCDSRIEAYSILNIGRFENKFFKTKAGTPLTNCLISRKSRIKVTKVHKSTEATFSSDSV